ncbi:MAG: DJ-1/PfpI family protein [bacterium]
MKNLPGVAVPLLSGLLVLSAVAFGDPSAATATRRWVCPPCGQPCDAAVFGEPGTCPKCGMALMDEAAARAAAAAQKRVAVLIFDGVQIIDYTGPFEVFGAAGFDVYTVAETKAPVTTSMGMTVVPKYAFGDAPPADILVVPGGSVKGPRESAATLKWIQDATAHASHTMSVCNGAFILASAGLLDGLTATTTYSNIDRLRSAYPKTKVVEDQRFVDNGKIITTGGLSAGIDGALHVVSKLLGRGEAQRVALSEEYDWRPEGGFARAALGDLNIPDFDASSVGRWSLVSTEGGTDRWEMDLRGTSDRSAADLVAFFDHAVAAGGKWTRIPAADAASSSGTGHWKFDGRDGKPWTGTLTVEAVPGEPHGYAVRLSVAAAS